MRDQSLWLEMEVVPDLRIIDDALWEAVHAEIKCRQRPTSANSPAGSKRKKHLLSGLIKYSTCGSNYTISGKDYYRCAGEKERGTCGNRNDRDRGGWRCRRPVAPDAERACQLHGADQRAGRNLA
jgi:hypothetical protein